MVIYGEFLFIENFITTFLLLVLTGILTGYQARFKRLILGSTIGALFSFMIFVHVTVVVSVIARVTMGFLCVYLTFGSSNLFSKTAIYFILTFTSGGMVMALLLWMQESAINHQGIIYINSITYLTLLALGVLAFGSTYWFIKLIRSRRIGDSVAGKVTLVIEDETYDFTAYVDSGNSLKEPISGKPVVLIDQDGARKLPFEPSSDPKRFSLIPYRTVGEDFGLMEGIRLDKIIYGSYIIEGAYLAFYKGKFDRYEVLLNKVFLEGGLLEDCN